MAYRVIQWSSGNVGAFALRSIIGHPELELAGLWVHSEKKAGRDAGELCGLEPVGVVASCDADALIAMDADCVVYTATADLRPMDAVDDICRILRSGKNLVSSSVVGLGHPTSLSPEITEKLETAGAAGGGSSPHPVPVAINPHRANPRQVARVVRAALAPALRSAGRGWAVLELLSWLLVWVPG